MCRPSEKALQVLTVHDRQARRLTDSIYLYIQCVENSKGTTSQITEQYTVWGSILTNFFTFLGRLFIVNLKVIGTLRHLP